MMKNSSHKDEYPAMQSNGPFPQVWDLSNPKTICKSQSTNGTFVLSRESAHIGQTLLHAGAKIGPLNSLTGSEPFDLAFLVTPSAFSKLTFSTSESSSIVQIRVNFPQTAQPVSSNTSGEVSAQKSDTIF